MSENQNNFIKWYKQPLENLYPNPDAGFAIAMISLPLLERYLREKSQVYEKTALSEEFYEECLKIFPAFGDQSLAKGFWQAFRHGLLHQVTFRHKVGSDPQIWITGSVPELKYDAQNKTFCLNPIWFSQEIVRVIESDFATFEGAGSLNHTLPTISTGSRLGLKSPPEDGQVDIDDSGNLFSGVASSPPSKRP